MLLGGFKSPQEAGGGKMVEIDEKAQFLKLLSRKSSVTILTELKEGPQRWKDLERVLYPRDLHQGLLSLFNAGMIKPTIIQDESAPSGVKGWELTPFGKKVAECIDELYDQYSKERSKPKWGINS